MDTHEERRPRDANWRVVCRQAAAEQAAREARATWQALGGEGRGPCNFRWEHVRAVVRIALRLAETLGADLDVAEAAAWLHDIRKGEPDHGVAGALAAETVLAQSDFPSAKIARVTDAIRQHAGLTRPDDAPPLQPLDAAILWDADKLSKLGVQALALNLCGLYEAEQTLEDRLRASQEYVYGVLRKTATSMNTAPARRLAKERYDAMQAALEAWEREERIAGL